MLAYISRRLGSRELIWGGLRADDVEAISDLRNVTGSFSIIGGYDRGGAVPSVDYEDLSGVRVDLDSWDIEDHLDTPSAHEFRSAILTRLARPTALLPYRASGFLSSILFARRDRCLDLGLFGALQAVFEHKPWVETNVAAMRIPQIPWVYVADEEQSKVRRMLKEGPVMLRVSRSSGGAGLVRVDNPDLLQEKWPHRAEAFVSVTPFLEGAVPINIGATVWHDGVTMGHPSFQLIGIPECTTRPFGYCGNDFGAATEIEGSALDAMEKSVNTLGEWLRRHHYRGAFGVDFLLYRGMPLFTEINPRFQGSTHASSQLSSEAGESCVILDHIAAMLGLDTPRKNTLRAIARATPSFSHFVIHWKEASAVVDSSPLAASLDCGGSMCRVDVAAKPTVVTHKGGVVLRVTTRDRITTTGFEIADQWLARVRDWINKSGVSPVSTRV